MKTLAANLALPLIVLVCGEPAFAQSQSGDRLTPLDKALELYQEFSGKTVLRSPNLPSLSEFNPPMRSSDTNGMRVVLENQLLQHGIQFIPHREVFALAVAVGWTNSPEAQYLATLKPRPTDASPSASLVPNPGDVAPGGEAIPPGTIDFCGADFNQFLDLYAMLANRSILRSSQLSSPTFNLRTQTPLTKSGAIYMMEIALGLHGIASVEDGTNFVQVAPINRVGNLKLQAPQRSPDDPLLDPKTIPDFRYSHSFVPAKGFQSNGPGAVNELVAYYAELTGRTAVSTNRIPSVPLIFRAQTFLTKPELLYALETTLALNGLAIIEVDNNTIRAGYLHELKRAEKKPQ